MALVVAERFGSVTGDLPLFVSFPANKGQKGFEKHREVALKAQISFAEQWRRYR